MKRILSIALLLTLVGVGYATEEITVELPGGAQMEFVWIRPGTFMMGTTEEQGQLLRGKGLWHSSFENELPTHEVTIDQGFYLGKYEITQGQWETVMETTPWSGKGYVLSDPDHPAVYISWNDVQAFISQLNKAAGDSLYRLPTEAEWEYACRAGTNTLWSFGDDEDQLGDYAWYRDNAWDIGEKNAHAVGTKLPNPWGLYDVHGNVWEWCYDQSRAIRGGYFYGYPRYTRSAISIAYGPGTRCGIGARLLRKPVKQIELPEHTIIENTSLAPKDGSRISIQVDDENLTKEQCRNIINKYRVNAGPEGQVAVNKPSAKLMGEIVPWCVDNMDGKGIFFNDHLF